MHCDKILGKSRNHKVTAVERGHKNTGSHYRCMHLNMHVAFGPILLSKSKAKTDAMHCRHDCANMQICCTDCMIMSTLPISIIEHN